MMERFTKAARRVVVLAQEEARERADDHIGSEHLLLGVCAVVDDPGARLLAARGVDLGVVRADLARPTAPDGAGSGDLDPDALASLGIDLDEVRSRVEDAFGAGALENTRAAGRARRGRLWGHIPFEADAKKVLELAVREAVRAQSGELGTEHLLLGLLREGTGRARRVLDEHGVTLAAIRDEVDGGRAA